VQHHVMVEPGGIVLRAEHVVGLAAVGGHQKLAGPPTVSTTSTSLSPKNWSACPSSVQQVFVTGRAFIS
jgi:hypothetical protein